MNEWSIVNDKCMSVSVVGKELYHSIVKFREEIKKAALEFHLAHFLWYFLLVHSSWQELWWPVTSTGKRQKERNQCSQVSKQTWCILHLVNSIKSSSSWIVMAQIYGEDISILHLFNMIIQCGLIHNSHRHTKTVFPHWFQWVVINIRFTNTLIIGDDMIWHDVTPDPQRMWVWTQPVLNRI